MVDDKLNKSIKAGAKKMGLSISSYARLALMIGLTNNSGLLMQAIKDVQNHEVETLSLEEFSDQIDKL
jgi:hypothetical protein